MKKNLLSISFLIIGLIIFAISIAGFMTKKIISGLALDYCLITFIFIGMSYLIYEK